MRRILLLASLVIACSSVWGQVSQSNLSLQIGYNFSRINPLQYNFAIDSIFNVENEGSEQLLSPARWGTGPTVSLAYHRRRTSFRLNGRLFFTESTAFTNPSGNESLRTDVAFNGVHISADITSRLIDFGRYNGIYVGAGISGNYFESLSATVPVDEYEPDDPLNASTEDWQVGFKLHIPYRLTIPEAHFGLSIEPYFMVFFSNLELDNFNTALNGPVERQFSDSMDHFGLTVSAIFFLRK